jgi:hypothetical protein
MSCCHGYCHHHHWCYGSPPYGPPEAYGLGYGPWRRGRPRRAPDEDDLAGYLHDLEDEIGRVRGELEELRRSRRTPEG